MKAADLTSFLLTAWKVMAVLAAIAFLTLLLIWILRRAGIIRIREEEEERELPRLETLLPPPWQQPRDERGRFAHVEPVPPPPQPLALPPLRDETDIYVHWCAARLDEHRDDRNQEYHRAMVLTMEAARALRDAAARVHDHEVVAEVLGRLRAARIEALERRFAACVARPEIARVEVTESGYRIVTTPLVIRVGGRSYQLGKLEANLDVVGRVRILNRTHRPLVRDTPYDHPMVRDGVPVLPGETRVRLIQSMAEHDPEKAVEALIIFLTEARTETLVPVTLWPEEERHDGRLMAEL